MDKTETVFMIIGLGICAIPWGVVIYVSILNHIKYRRFLKEWDDKYK